VVPDRDPLTILMAPPSNETPEEKARRLEEERLREARNAEIEEMLRVERISLNSKKFVKVLLVGESSRLSRILSYMRLMGAIHGTGQSESGEIQSYGHPLQRCL
jgi:hypothetical protein